MNNIYDYLTNTEIDKINLEIRSYINYKKYDITKNIINLSYIDKKSLLIIYSKIKDLGNMEFLQVIYNIKNFNYFKIYLFNNKKLVQFIDCQNVSVYYQKYYIIINYFYKYRKSIDNKHIIISKTINGNIYEKYYLNTINCRLCIKLIKKYFLIIYNRLYYNNYNIYIKKINKNILQYSFNINKYININYFLLLCII